MTVYQCSVHTHADWCDGKNTLAEMAAAACAAGVKHYGVSCHSHTPIPIDEGCVLDADMSLYSGSYRAAENTFNMLTQVVGRAGRGDTPGKAMIQTMVPEHKVLELAAKQDYDGFYDLEIGLRQIQNCPPFGDMASITFVGQEEAQVLHGAAKFRDSLNACLKQPGYEKEICRVLGPAPCAVPKINYNFRYRLTLKCRMSRLLRQLIAHLLREFAKDGTNRGVNAFADVNGFDE